MIECERPECAVRSEKDLAAAAGEGWWILPDRNGVPRCWCPVHAPYVPKVGTK